MFTLISDLPNYAVGVTAAGEITASDYKSVLVPAVEKALAEWKGVNLLLVLETELKNFTLGAWLQDLKVNTAYFLKWNKLALVDHSPVLEVATAIVSVIAPGEVKTFSAGQLKEAKAWVSTP